MAARRKKEKKKKRKKFAPAQYVRPPLIGGRIETVGKKKKVQWRCAKEKERKKGERCKHSARFPTGGKRYDRA